MPAMVPPVADETGLLLAYLEQQRTGARLSALGLTDAQAGTTPTASALSLGGVIKHLAAVERSWTHTILQELQQRTPDDYMAGFRMTDDETVESLTADYVAAAQATDDVVRRLGLDCVVPVPKGVPWYPADVETWTVRWVVLHLIEETARHAGQADIIRETIDGASSVSLLAAAEGWPETEWVKPWQPASAVSR